MAGQQRFWLQSSMVLTAASLLVAIGNYVFQAIMGRALSLAEFGYLNTTLAQVGMLTVALTAASQAVTHHLARHQASDRPEEIARLKAASSSFLVYLTIACSLGVLLVIKPVTDFFHVPRNTLTLVALGCILVNMWSALATSWCAGLSRFNLLAGLTLASVMVRLLAGGGGSRVWPTAELGVGASIAAGLVLVAGATWSHGGMPRPSHQHVRPILEPAFIRYLLASLAVCGGQYLFFQGDLLVAQRQLVPDTVGAYSAAGLFGRAVVWLPFPVLTVFFTARSGQPRSDQATIRLLLLFTGLMAVGATGVWLTRDWLGQLLLGRAEPAAVGLMGRFAVAMIPVGLLQALGFYFLSARKLAACFLFGVMGVGYWMVLDQWGQEADELVRLILVTAGASVAILAAAAVATRQRTAAKI